MATVAADRDGAKLMSDEPPIDVLITPDRIQIAGAHAIARTLHADERGFLLETLRKDDAPVRGDRFAMSYVSLTVPGQFRDRDRWHVHRIQTDRFVVAVGEMVLALYDGRPDSPTRGRREVIRMEGAPFDRLSAPVKEDRPGFLVPIPPGVHHCIGNLSDRPFLLVNFPTELYDPADEGRVPFSEAPYAAGLPPFSWERVQRPGTPSS